MNLPPLKKEKLYGNCRVYHPDGDLMFLCSAKRINWYLSRNLATIINEDPLSIKLNFIPQGKGNSNRSFSLERKENKCVCCGIQENLTKHHVIPSCFRKHFPDYLKSRNMHDVLIMCVSCHSKYEEFAVSFKKRLANSNNSFFHSKTSPKNLLIKKINGYENILKNCNKLNIPQSRIEEIQNALNKSKLELENLLDLPKHDFGKEVVSNTKDIQKFNKVWRIHFLEIMKPKFMPKYWSVDHKI